MVMTKPAQMRVFWEYLFANLAARLDVNRMPIVEAVRIKPV